ncbi:hypothetical protein A2707_02445 [Candidatus Saccharibacteria bacterium RIFCSPHIGHO2_01_FULL_45_15]|nr:MAG: hypothetical protein A2707_02445 [Candidatus Saccharibacteria bacterium RIFCSPHIGHO2_01_FULL_45_15]OGL28755.1 MAG: hypothetical protein A3C39_00280 [Candidatus Saccharibacteria bacterium RIFCSPHIGHO2_02_FULL_46_12]OGL31789.1 MAG: hypothetical protein A3E76_03040 [Candidatus Saccharibacteria bacterium RIFCSPHIGHO2_12_FULL_44_22]
MKAYTSRFITGFAIILVGGLFLANNLNIVDTTDFLSNWWPLGIILAGIIIFINDTKNYLWALLVVGFGAVLQLQVLDSIDVNPWQVFWPVAIIVVGISILLNQSAYKKRVTKSDRNDITAILGGNDQRNSSEDFKGSKITAVMGGVKLDLHKAVIKKEAVIDVFALMGGIEIVVPRDVLVKNQTSAILGGVENKAEPDKEKGAPVLYITGDVVLGGVEIKN